ncbi:hypothetical protein C0J52_13276 [Blattella germanica]|nr:hypothetical protein C0J52_13276 [Blattella germanica]
MNMSLTGGLVTDWVIVKDEVHNSEIATASTLIQFNNVKQNQYEELKNSSYNRAIEEYNYGIKTRSIAIDTYDLDHYEIEKSKCTSKTIGVDTSDLEAHYEYYKHENLKRVKTVSTDTRDLDYLKRIYATSSISVDTTDLQTFIDSRVSNVSSQNGICKSEPEIDVDNLVSNSKSSSKLNHQKEGRSKVNAVNNKFEAKSNPSSEDESSDDKFDVGLDDDNSESISEHEDDDDLDDKDDSIKKEGSVTENVYRRKETGRTKGSKTRGDCNSTKKFECEVCKATFTRKHSLMVHLCIHSGLRPFTCTGCGKAFSTSSQAQRHARLHLQSSLEDNVKDEPGLDQETADSGTGVKGENEIPLSVSLEEAESKFGCTMCDMTFDCKQTLLQHKRAAHSLANRPRECLTCGKVFTCASALKCHETVHTGARDFACVTCGKAFPTKTCLKAHEATHTGLKRFVCQTCGKAFAKKDSLKVHNRKHTNERPFSCDLCGRAFDRAFTLKNHRLTHTGEKTHMCAVCGKAFSTRGALSTHERIRHNTDPDKPKVYKRRARDFEPSVCDQCGKVYSNRGNLRIHKASAHSTEKPFLCTACGRSFAKKYTLQCHARKHSNERPFPCDQCNQSFYRKSTLKTHKLRHTGARPYVCPLNCGKAFTQSSSLSYHVRHHDRPPRAANGKKRKRKKPKTGLEPPPLTLAPLCLLGAVGTVPQPQEPSPPPPPPLTFSTATYQPNGVPVPPCVTTQSLTQL